MNNGISRNDLPLLMTQKMAEKHLGITAYAFYRLASVPNSPIIKLGGKYLLNRDKFFDYVDNNLSEEK